MKIAVGPAQYHLLTGGKGPKTLVIFHGFTGSAASYIAPLTLLTDYFKVIAVDLPGHGATEVPEMLTAYSFSQVAADLHVLWERLGLIPSETLLLGYSLGGRLALYFVVAERQRGLAAPVSSLILESASPGLATEDLRAERRISDAQLAEFILREGVEKFVDYWENIPLWQASRLTPLAKSHLRTARLANKATGLAYSLQGMGVGSQSYLLESFPIVTLKVLLITGALDHKFTEIARQMQAYLPSSQLEIMPEVGHMPHLENPELFQSLLKSFAY